MKTRHRLTCRGSRGGDAETGKRPHSCSITENQAHQIVASKNQARRQSRLNRRSTSFKVIWGFTLVELLVVISIVIILVGLIMPMLGQAWQRVRAEQCENSLHQVGIAALIYMQENVIPLTIDLAKVKVPLREPELRLVTAHLKPIPPVPPPLSGTNPVNFPIANCPFGDPNPAYSLNPSNEPPWRSYGALQSNLGKPLDDASPWLITESAFRTIQNASDVSWWRHQGRFNVLYTDGHVERQTIDQLIFP